MKKRNNFYYGLQRGLMILAAVSIVSCGGEPEAKEVVRPVKMFTIPGFGPGEASRRFPGNVEAVQDIPLAFEVGGKLMQLEVEKGQNVQKGALIARLDPERYKNAFLQQQANFNQANNDYARNRSLYENGAIAAAKLDTFQRALDVAKANLETAKKNLNDTVLRAPFSGTVALIPAENFTNVSAGQEIVRLQDMSSLQIRVNIPEAFITSRNRGRQSVDAINERIEARAFLTTNEEARFPVRLKSAETDADPATRTYSATFALNPPDRVTILPGMTAVVEIEFKDVATQTEAASVHRIPTTAVAADPEGKQFVWVVDEETMEVSKRVIQAGEIINDQIEVTDGLTGGETVVAAGVSYLRDGAKVSRMNDSNSN